MTSLPLLLLLVLCVSLHACTPRPLTKKDTAKYRFVKGLDEVKLLETLTTPSVKDYKLEENQAQQQKVANNEINICEGCSSVSTLKEMIVATASGTSFQTDSPSFLAAKDQRKQARSMLGPTQHHVEETVVTNANNDSTEDIVEMDYAQPHRKPPIHNEKP